MPVSFSIRWRAGAGGLQLVDHSSAGINAVCVLVLVGCFLFVVEGIRRVFLLDSSYFCKDSIEELLFAF